MPNMITPVSELDTQSDSSLSVNSDEIFVINLETPKIPTFSPSIVAKPKAKNTGIGIGMLDQELLAKSMETPEVFDQDPIYDLDKPITIAKTHEIINTTTQIPQAEEVITLNHYEFNNIDDDDDSDSFIFTESEQNEEMSVVDPESKVTIMSVPRIDDDISLRSGYLADPLLDSSISLEPTTTYQTIPTPQEPVTLTSTPIKVAPIVKPIVLEEDDLLDIHISSNEPVTPVELDIEKSLIEPFDQTTPNTLKTDKQYAEIIIPNISDESNTSLEDKISPDGTYFINSSKYTQDEKRNLHAKLNDPTSLEFRMVRSSLFQSDKQTSESDSLQKAKDAGHKLANAVKIGDTIYSDKKAGENQLSKLASGDIIQAKDSFPVAMALIGGIRKVHLYNSGFWITIRPPLLHELHTYYLNCKQNTKQYGSIFGQLSYLPADVDIREAGMDLIKSCITKSNLVNWNVDNNFEKAVSFLDYDTCLWGLASLMFPTGTPIEYVCVRDTCTNIERQQIDIGDIRYFDITRLGEEALKYCYSNEFRSLEDLNHYKRDIIKDSIMVSLNDNWSVTIGVPSFFDEQEDGKDFVADMSTMIQITEMADVQEYLAARYFRALSPWITRITYTKLDDGKKIHFEDATKLPDIITALQLIDVPLPEKIKEVMENSKISYFCYSYDKCPKCGTTPTLAIDGLIPCDMQQSFFSHTTEHLR